MQSWRASQLIGFAAASSASNVASLSDGVTCGLGRNSTIWVDMSVHGPYQTVHSQSSRFASLRLAQACHTVFGKLLGDGLVERRRRCNRTALALDASGAARERSAHRPERPEPRVLFFLQDVRAGTRPGHGAGPPPKRQAPAPTARGHDRSTTPRAPRSGYERTGKDDFCVIRAGAR
jgi:hypothetical protein